MNNSVKLHIQNGLKEVLRDLVEAGAFSRADTPSVFVSQPRREEWGDLSTNLPFLLSEKWRRPASEVARVLIDALERVGMFSRIEFAPPGFINFTISPVYLQQTLSKILTQEGDFTRFSEGGSRRVQVEFVSANPTGPLHVGHGRAAAVGDSLSNILSKLGYRVEREYYVNDRGGQIERLARSVWARIQELEGRKVHFPEDGNGGAKEVG